MDEPLRQNTQNPQTGVFEMLSHLEWLRLKVGYSKDVEIDEDTCYIKGGPEWIARMYFADECKWVRAREVYIEELYKKWWPKHPSRQQLLGWVLFVKDVYNLQEILKAREEFVRLGKAMVKNVAAIQKTSKEYNAALR